MTPSVHYGPSSLASGSPLQVASHKAYVSTPALTINMPLHVRADLLTQHSVRAAPWHKPICPATSAQGSNSNNRNQSSERNVDATARVPVVVVGAGPTGLTLSTLLGKLGIPNLVLDSAAALPNHPQVTGPTNCICLWRALPDATALQSAVALCRQQI